MKEQDEFLFTSGASDCCGAPVYDDYMICSSCKEHTTYYEPVTVGTYNDKPKVSLFKIRLNQLKKFKK
jgi:hypothetical protein